ncbi:tumor necrosis factor receptor superfamily member 10B-like [Conger conger]|uniref:tumor necrosis factor receptor superfamily member 10B-like n=1 Tax=Conger conger TaxID=82655 RepID=UPI002A5ACFFC|nr:tumor necrosis factor receptor superfamily member 10B-like [Conger conger]
MSRWDLGPHFKMNFQLNTVIVVCLTLSVTAKPVDQDLNRPWNGEWNKTAPQIQCVENQQYAHDGHCCRNCPAGTYVKRPCVQNFEVGICAPCGPGTYTEHATGMDRCLTCTPCHLDQVETVPCTKTQNRQCQCKPGSFCETDGPCEVCKKCARCKVGQEKVRNCTPTSNTQCRPSAPPSPTPSTPTASPPAEATAPHPAAYIVPILAIILGIGAVGCYCFWKKRQSGESTETSSGSNGDVKNDMVRGGVGTPEEGQGRPSAGTEEPRQESQPLLQETQAARVKSVPVEDEDRGLGDSLPNTTNSSQTSLSAPATMPSCGSTPRHSPAPHRQPASRGERLIPLNGDESLKKSFYIFEDCLDVKIHKRFFRAIDLSDNAIESAQAEDKVYELLKVWMQRLGSEANINDLLDKLCALDQKLSAERIRSRVVKKGYYRYDDGSN